MISVLFKPSISRSGVTTTLCCITGIAASFISSGVTKSLPFIAAHPFQAFTVATEALGEAPKYRNGFSRVLKTIFAMYSIRCGSIRICFTKL